MAEKEPEIVAAKPSEDAGQFIHQPAKIMRIAAMIRELLVEVRQSSPDAAGRDLLRTIYERALAELKDTLSEDLQHELDTFMRPLSATPSESELRVAKAQLVGWLEGLFQGIQAALYAQQLQARAQLQEMRRRGLPPGMADPDGNEPPHGPGPGQYL
jgi:hypothetical protein